MAASTARALRLVRAGRSDATPAARPAGGSRAGRVRAAAVIALAVAALACGQKSAPLPPLLILPARIDDFTVRRLGDVVRMKLTVPSRNQGAFGPADLDRIEVYAFTGKPERIPGRPLDDLDFQKYGTLVASIDISPPPPPPPEEGEETPEPPPPPPPDDGLPKQGSIVTVVEPLRAEAYEPVEIDERSERSRDARPSIPYIPAFWPPDEPELTRSYMAVGINSKGRPGQGSARVAIPLIEPPSAPPAPKVDYTETLITITWSAPVDAPRPLQPPPAPGLLASTPVMKGVEPYSYNVYSDAPEMVALTPAGPPQPVKPYAFQADETGEEPLPDPDGRLMQPLNAAPVPALTHQDKPVVLGETRCYVIRTVQKLGTLQIESPPSPETCVTLHDVFAPAPPAGLAAVASEGVISLIWEPSPTDDVAGYVVLRGEAPAPALARITPDPILETTFRDQTVTPGVRYVYAVVAVDRATPPNVSAESNRVEETAR